MSEKVKITITDDAIDMDTALRCIYKVIEGGRISKGRHGDQYCYVTTFTAMNMNLEKLNVIVYADRTKAGMDTFRVGIDPHKPGGKGE